MPIIDTKHIFEASTNRMGIVSRLVQGLFPETAREAVCYELLGQGLLVSEVASVPFDYWEIVRELMTELQKLWEGPDVPIYILPMRQGAHKNGVSYQRGICLFVTPQVTPRALQALAAHEYCHSCHRPFLNHPPTLIDSLITEGVAEYAVESLYGQDALNPWTVRYSHEEIEHYWQTVMKPNLYETGLHNHRKLLMGGEQIPRWLGYCTGYRIVQAFLAKQGPHTIKELLIICPETIVAKAGFALR